MSKPLRSSEMRRKFIVLASIAGIPASIAGCSSRSQAEMAQLRAEMASEAAEREASDERLTADLAALRTDIQAMHTEFDAEIEAVMEPPFPWPPPVPSARLSLGRASFPDLWRAATISEVADMVAAAFMALDLEVGFQRLPGGLTLLTGAQAFGPDGKPTGAVSRSVGSMTFYEILGRLFSEPPGRYRFFVVAITNGGFTPGGDITLSALTRVAAEASPIVETDGVLNHDHAITLMVYEFRIPTTEDVAPIQEVPGRFTAAQHVELSGLAKQLRQ